MGRADRCCDGILDKSLARGWGGGRTGAILDDAETWAASGSFAAESGEAAEEGGGDTRDDGAGGVGGGCGDDGGEFGRGTSRAAAEASLGR